MNPTLVSTAQSVVDQVKDIDSAWAHSVEGVQTAECAILVSECEEIKKAALMEQVT